MQVESIPLDQIRQFSTRDSLYYQSPEKFSNFVSHIPTLDNFPAVIEAKAKSPTDRQLLSDVVTIQYAKHPSSSKTQSLISNLSKDNTYAVTTAHQPSLLTGPLYYIYKILSTINLAETLQKKYPDNNYVPVFVIGSEDHDFEEVNHLHLFGKTVTWNRDGQGSVGHYSIEGLDEILTEVNELLGSYALTGELITQLRADLTSIDSYQEFAFKLTHLLFDSLGLVILSMDDPKLKQAFIPIIKKEILERPSQKLVQETQEKIKAELDLNSQAHAREINFFFTGYGGRSRIIFSDGIYQIDGTEKTFTEAELVTTIDEHPEWFSPNVIMRPLYQELILPNLAYIGGGGEIAYWTERLSQFDHFGVPMPMLIRRRSAMIVTPEENKLMQKLDFSWGDIFHDKQSLISRFLDNSDHPDYKLDKEREQLNKVFEMIAEKAKSVDVTLAKTAGAENAKLSKSLDYLQNKMKKALKQKESVSLNRMDKLHGKLFPGGLQERHNNILQYISAYGLGLIEDMLEHCDPLERTFKVFRMS